jgi:hypothetical protein
MIEIKTITGGNADKETLDHMLNRVAVLKSLIFKYMIEDSDLKDAPLIRMIQLHLGGLEREIELCKDRI